MTTTIELAVAGAPAIPGLRFRRLRDAADYAALAGLMTAASLADDTDMIPDTDGLQVDYENITDFVPRRDLLLAEVHDDLVGFGEATRQVRDGVAVYNAIGQVHPDWRGRGIGRAILRYTEAHLRSLAEEHDDPGGRVLGSWVQDREQGAGSLLEAEGYAPVRFGFAMRRKPLDDIPEAILPDGVEIREVQPDHHRAIFDADSEAFRDHWGHRESTERDFQRTILMPNLDRSLWSVAWDGDEVVGSVQTFVWAAENEALGVRRGWLERISVRRPWRRRGVARAIIADALRRLHAVGMDEAMLGVDSENRTGALQLYESLGFEVAHRSTTYRKPW